MRTAFLIATLLATPALAAEPDMACWDGTFAYQTVGLWSANDTHQWSIGGIRMRTSVLLSATGGEEAIFTPYHRTGTLFFEFTPDDCRFKGPNDRPKSIRCEAADATVYLAHDIVRSETVYPVVEALDIEVLSLVWKRGKETTLRVGLGGAMGAKKPEMAIGLPHCNFDGTTGTDNTNWKVTPFPESVQSDRSPALTDPESPPTESL